MFASVDLDEDGLFAGKDVEDIVSALDRADVVGLSCAAEAATIAEAVRRFAALTESRCWCRFA